MAVNPFSLKSICIVTGASRGIGRCVFCKFAAKFPKGSLMIGLARGVDALEETKKLSLETAPEVDYVMRKFDQGSLDQKQFDDLLQDCLEGRSVKDYQQAVIMHNSGTFESEMSEDLMDVNRISNNFNINVAGTICLTAQFLRIFKDVPRKLVLNMSSISAVKPMASLSLYCSGKAARLMYFQCLAEEYPELRILNYSPGPVGTDMFFKVALPGIKHPDVSEAFKGMAGSLLKAETTVERFIGILEKDEYTNADNIDYYDDK